jgi:transcriptional regulator with XRE-family HTH domain
MTLGEKIRARRKELHLTQAQLAGGDFTAAFVSQLERNILRPSLKTLSIIAARLNLPISSILGEQSIDAEVRLMRARFLFNAGRLDDAETMLEEIIREEPSRERLVLLSKVLQARILLTKQDPTAIAVCTDFLGKLPEAHRDIIPEIEVLRGSALWQSGERVAAINSWEVALSGVTERADPRLRVSLLHNLAVAYVQVGQGAKGEAFYSALSREIERSGDLERMATMFHDFSMEAEADGVPGEASKFAMMAESISESKKYLSVMVAGTHNLGVHAARRGHYEEAMKNFEGGAKMAKVIGDSHDTAVSLANLAGCLLVLGRSAEALGMCHEAVNLLPKLANRRTIVLVHFATACAYESQGEAGPAARQFRDAVSLIEQDGGLPGAEGLLAEAWHHLSLVTVNKEQSTEAAAKAQALFRKLRRIPNEHPAEAMFL